MTGLLRGRLKFLTLFALVAALAMTFAVSVTMIDDTRTEVASFDAADVSMMTLEDGVVVDISNIGFDAAFDTSIAAITIADPDDFVDDVVSIYNARDLPTHNTNLPLAFAAADDVPDTLTLDAIGTTLGSIDAPWLSARGDGGIV